MPDSTNQGFRAPQARSLPSSTRKLWPGMVLMLATAAYVFAWQTRVSMSAWDLPGVSDSGSLSNLTHQHPTRS